MSSKYIFIGDIERCPYVPSNPEWDKWNKANDERLENLSKVRKHIHDMSFAYSSHEDRNIRDMCLFIQWLFNRN